MRILVTGAAGMLGRALVPIAMAKRHEVYATDLISQVGFAKNGAKEGVLDVTDPAEVAKGIRTSCPDLIIHLAAMTDLEECEDNPETAANVNAIGTLNMASAAKQISARFVYVSTAGVFDGRKTLYTEDNTPNPINIYGKTKLHGEDIVKKINPNSLIVRAGWMFGGGPNKDHKFVGMLMNQITYSGDRVLKVVDDKHGSPTWTKDLSNAIMGLVAAKAYGLWHCAGRGGASRFEVAEEIVKIVGRPDIQVEKTGSAHFSDDFYAPRPHHEVLDMRAPALMRPWRLALREYLRSEWMHPETAAAKSHAETA